MRIVRLWCAADSGAGAGSQVAQEARPRRAAAPRGEPLHRGA